MSQTPTIIGQSLRQWRKIKGLSQLELALEANVSARHISFIENGKTLPTREMLLDLSDGLKLQMEERNSLLVSAGYVPDVPKLSWDSVEMGPIRTMLTKYIDQMPFCPAVILDTHFRIVAQNSAFRILEDILPSDVNLEEANMIELLVADNGLKPLIENWEDVHKFAVARLREIIYRQHDPHLFKVLEMLTQEYEELQEPKPQSVSEMLGNLSTQIHIRIFDQLLKLSLFLLMPGRTFDILAEDLYILSIIPVDESSEQLLQMIYKSRSTHDE